MFHLAQYLRSRLLCIRATTKIKELEIGLRDRLVTNARIQDVGFRFSSLWEAPTSQ